MIQQALSVLKQQRNRIAQADAAAVDQFKSQQEKLFIETCIGELTASNQESSSGSDSDLVSQTEFAAFIIRYCRDDEDLRGSECSNALFFFQDLPNEIQLEFLRHTNDTCPSDIADNFLLQDCLDELNADGGLFFVSTDTIPDLCRSTFDLMISTKLLVNSTTLPGTEAPLTTLQPTASVAPTLAPSNVLLTPEPTIGHNLDHGNKTGLSSVGILGIVMTALFVIIFAIQCAVLHHRKRNSKKSQMANDVVALREDESVVASEHSHELLSPIAEVKEMPTSSTSIKNRNHPIDSALAPTDDGDLTISSGSAWSWGTPRSGERRDGGTNYHGPKKSSTPRNATTSPLFRSVNSESTEKSHSKDTSHKFFYPRPLITENLSDSNPVHVRKRFHKKLDGFFPFDEDDVNQAVVSLHDDSTHNDFDDSSQQHKSNNSPSVVHTGKENDSAARHNILVRSMNSVEKQATKTCVLKQGSSCQSSSKLHHHESQRLATYSSNERSWIDRKAPSTNALQYPNQN